MIREELKGLYLDTEYWYGEESYLYDQAYDTFPCVFPSVHLQLGDTHGLNALADDIRKKEGVLPFFDDSGEYNDDAWYNFFICLNGYTRSHVDACIRVEAEPCDRIDDDIIEFYIDLTEEEQDFIYNQIDALLQPATSCEQELQNAAEYWKAHGTELTILERRTV